MVRVGIKGCMGKKELEVRWDSEGKGIELRKVEVTCSRTRKAKRGEIFMGL